MSLQNPGSGTASPVSPGLLRLHQHSLTPGLAVATIKALPAIPAWPASIDLPPPLPRPPFTTLLAAAMPGSPTVQYAALLTFSASACCCLLSSSFSTHSLFRASHVSFLTCSVAGLSLCLPLLSVAPCWPLRGSDHNSSAHLHRCAEHLGRCWRQPAVMLAGRTEGFPP